MKRKNVREQDLFVDLHQWKKNVLLEDALSQMGLFKQLPEINSRLEHLARNLKPGQKLKIEVDTTKDWPYPDFANVVIVSDDGKMTLAAFDFDTSGAYVSVRNETLFRDYKPPQKVGSGYEILFTNRDEE